jgi:undecaprenyl-diphosphatase
MSFIEALILGVVEGLTEYLPVSSTGHLILAQRVMGIGQDKVADAYAVAIQSGAILAVAGLYFSYLARMFRGLVGRDPEGLRLHLNVAVAFAPAAIVGLLFMDAVTTTLFGLWPIVIAWFVGGVAILLVTWYRRNTHRPQGRDIFDLRWQHALVIGLLQCLAVWPGTSRSLVTIVGGVLVGLSLRSAVIFSFILGALTLAAGTAYEVITDGPAMLKAYGWVNLTTGFAAAALSAMVAVKWMVGYLKQHGLAVFGYYRVVLSLLVAGLLAGGFMTSR